MNMFNFKYNTESTSEAITVEDAASPNVPLTTFEAYDVENSTLENVTLEFVDLPTTEAISSTTNTLQYLETASYKEGNHHYNFIYEIEKKIINTKFTFIFYSNFKNLINF